MSQYRCLIAVVNVLEENIQIIKKKNPNSIPYMGVKRVDHYIEKIQTSRLKTITPIGVYDLELLFPGSLVVVVMDDIKMASPSANKMVVV